MSLTKKTTLSEKQSDAKRQAAHRDVEKAKRRLQKGDIKDAGFLLQRACKVDADNPDWLLLFADTLIQANNSALAEKHLLRCLQLKPDMAEAQLLLTKHYLNSAQYSKALPLALKAVEQLPHQQAAQLALAQAYHQNAKLDQAVVQLRRVVETLVEQPPSAHSASAAVDVSGSSDALLWQTLEQLAANGIKAFAFNDTLMSLMRERRSDCFNKRLKLGVPYSELGQVRNVMEDDGWFEQPLLSGVSNPLSFYYPPAGLTVDLFGVAASADTAATYSGIWVQALAPAQQLLLQLPDITLELSQSPSGNPVWMLTNGVEFLTQQYGDWKNYEVDRDTTVDVCNYVSFSAQAQCLAMLRLIGHWQNGRVNQACSVLTLLSRELPGDERWGQLLAVLQANHVASK